MVVDLVRSISHSYRQMCSVLDIAIILESINGNKAAVGVDISIDLIEYNTIQQD